MWRYFSNGVSSECSTHFSEQSTMQCFCEYVSNHLFCRHVLDWYFVRGNIVGYEKISYFCISSTFACSASFGREKNGRFIVLVERGRPQRDALLPAVLPRSEYLWERVRYAKARVATIPKSDRYELQETKWRLSGIWYTIPIVYTVCIYGTCRIWLQIYRAQHTVKGTV